MPRKSATVPTNETAEQRFVRLANATVNRLLKGFKSLAGLKGKRFNSTIIQRTKIKETLTAELTRSLESLNNPTAASTDLFKL